MGFLSRLFGNTESQKHEDKVYKLSMLEISRLYDYPQRMRDEYASYVNTCLTKHPEQRWAEWAPTHPSPYVYYSIAGINYRKGIRQFVGSIDCLLVEEPTNPHDPNAIRVEEYNTHHHIGYIPAESTYEVRNIVTLPHHCTATIQQQRDDSRTFFTGRICIEKPTP